MKMFKEPIHRYCLRSRMWKRESMRRRGKRHGWIHEEISREVRGPPATQEVDPRKNMEVAETGLRANEAKQYRLD